MTKLFKVLITGIGSTTAISVIKGLKSQNEFPLLIFGTDTNKKESIAGASFCDKYFQIPPACNCDKYLKKLHHIITKESIDLVIPIVDIELSILAKHKKRFQKITRLLLSSSRTIDICNNKYKTYQFFKINKIPTLTTIKIKNVKNINEILKSKVISFPFIAKPLCGVSSRSVYIINNNKELSLINNIPNPIIQQKAHGKEFTIDIFRANKHTTFAVPRERIETRSGISYKGQTVLDKQLITYAKSIANKLNIIGPANIQCFRSNKKIYFLEINPRFSGGLPLTTAAGINMPHLALKIAAKQKLTKSLKFKKVFMCRYFQEHFHFYNQ